MSENPSEVIKEVLHRSAYSHRVAKAILILLTFFLFYFRFARDNVFNFIKFCRMLEVMEVVMFETEDLVSQEQTQSFHS
jgi:hypothetical protein